MSSTHKLLPDFAHRVADIFPHLANCVQPVRIPRNWCNDRCSNLLPEFALLPYRVWVLYTAECFRPLLEYVDEDSGMGVTCVNKAESGLEAAVNWVLDPSPGLRNTLNKALDGLRIHPIDSGGRRYFISYASSGLRHSIRSICSLHIHHLITAVSVVTGVCGLLSRRLTSRIAKSQWRWLYRAYQGVVGSKWSPQWNTATVIDLAKHIFHSADFSLMPIMADALQDAGCADVKLLTRLRKHDSVFTKADVCLWQPMGLGAVEKTETFRSSAKNPNMTPARRSGASICEWSPHLDSSDVVIITHPKARKRRRYIGAQDQSRSDRSRQESSANSTQQGS